MGGKDLDPVPVPVRNESVLPIAEVDADSVPGVFLNPFASCYGVCFFVCCESAAEADE